MIKTLVAIIFVFCVCSCGNKHELNVNDRGDIEVPNNSSGAVVDSEVAFADVLTAVFQKDCASCHSEYLQYQNVKIDLDRILSEVLSNSMPQFGPPLSDEQKILLQDWAALGSPEK